MAKKKILYGMTEELVVNKFFTSITGRLSDRAKRIYESIGQKAADRWKKGDRLPEDSDLTLKLGWNDKDLNKARSINLALEEFKQENPKGYKQLKEMIDKHRSVRRATLTFGGNVSQGVYIRAIQNVIGGIDEREAIAFYEKLVFAEESLGKKTGGLTDYLLPE